MADEKRKIHLRIRKDVEAFLKSLGSTTSEIKVFMVLSSARKYLSVKELEEKTGLSSKSVRLALKRLLEKGLVKEKESDNRKIYRSKSVKELVEIWKKRVEDALTSLLKRP
jgi:predicted DNA-binding transcriptional regulator